MIQWPTEADVCSSQTVNRTKIKINCSGPGARLEAESGAPGRPPRPLTSERQALALRHIGLVGVHLRNRLGSRRRTPRGQRNLGELFQAGCLALVQAAGRYDPRRDGEFPAFALPRIRRAIHAAVLAEQSLVRVPYGAACRGRRGMGLISARTRGLLPVGQDPSLAESLDQCVSPDDESIRHALRRRFENAARRAIEALARQDAPRRDTAAMLRRIADERILVNAADQRTPIRRLADELGVSAGLVARYEQRILKTTHEQIRSDLPANLLIRFAQEDPAGFDGPVHAARRRRLLRAELRQFERHFARLNTAERARTLYGLLERSSAGIPEVARNLFLLAHTYS